MARTALGIGWAINVDIDCDASVVAGSVITCSPVYRDSRGPIKHGGCGSFVRLHLLVRPRCQLHYTVSGSR